MSVDRFPPITPEQWSTEQASAAQEVIDGPRGALLSPFIPLLRSPELMTHAQRMGEYLRYRSALGLRLSEFVILVVAQLWEQPVEWAIHMPIAEREGVKRSTIESLAEGRIPTEMAPDEAIAYAFSIELHHNKAVSQTTWDKALEIFGEQGIADLIGINGYYSFLAMAMNACLTEVPQEVEVPLKRTVY